LKPQGEDGATLTVMPKNDHAALLSSEWFEQSDNSQAGRENQFAADQTR
jgi:hypothetical protein